MRPQTEERKPRAFRTHVWATADWVHWHQYPFGCPGAGYGLSGIAAASRSQVVFLCTNAEGMFLLAGPGLPLPLG
jgi:hypothetical protein